MPRVIQICDDDPAVRRVLARLFSPDYAVVEAAGGREALALIAERCPDLVLLDVDMPGLNGLETLEAYRKTRPFLPTIVLAGAQELEIARRALDLGARAYVTKPFDAAALREEVERALGAGPAEAGGRPWRLRAGTPG